jgi:hypothetical protein
VQLELTVDPELIFPPSYPYTSGTTRILRDNFSALYKQTNELLKLEAQDLVVDIGSNDGTLLSNFKNGGHRVWAQPTDTGKIAEGGIPTLNLLWRRTEEAAQTWQGLGDHRANCLHISRTCIPSSGSHHCSTSAVFITESHYLIAKLERPNTTRSITSSALPFAA